MHPPDRTPRTSRCGYLRSRKRINPHPITQLMKLAKAEKSEEHSTEPESSSNPESQPAVQDSGTDGDQDIGKLFKNSF
ncbi:uncharacterized protein LOC119562874 [Drosophila subpulchrella]|uniref:uncharacterized protein LOC119562874 n=1 Tax=Drosophila subpulchrella TaxID=1486046 RepID=UPI0018A13501|nr:uncharacterized protein LOC119562874 [Drosophila subpulchrella]